MLGAMYENGGNTTHRFLDGHPQLFVYPYESQIGTRYVLDSLTSMFPCKYRWPEFRLDGTPFEDYTAIIDEETKVRARTPHVSKFRHVPFDFNDDERWEIYKRDVERSGRSRANNVAAFFRATFEAWKNYRGTRNELMYVGYSPIIVVDAEKILTDFPQAHFLHIVRNPWSAYADTKKRPVPLSLDSYMLGWTLNQSHALLFQEKFLHRLHVIRFEDVIANPYATLGALCDKLGLARAESLRVPTWNGTELQEIYPWGTIRKATPDANRAAAQELSERERSEIQARARQYLEAFDYKGIV